MEQPSDSLQWETEYPRPDLADEALRIVRYTRNWLHYGVLAFIVVTSLIAALRGAVAP